MQDPTEALRGRLFTDLDALAFALEIEAAAALEAGDEPLAQRLEDRRLGVRLAQRRVSGVHADEVDLRLAAARDAYERATDGGGGGGAGISDPADPEGGADAAAGAGRGSSVRADA